MLILELKGSNPDLSDNFSVDSLQAVMTAFTPTFRCSSYFSKGSVEVQKDLTKKLKAIFLVPVKHVP